MVDASNHHLELSINSTAPLPEGYGDNRLVIMTRDPQWFFAYWEVTFERAEQIRVSHGADAWDKAVLTLRVYDLGDSAHPSVAESSPHYDVDVHKFARQAYAKVPHAGHAYAADLGLRWPDGKFVFLFRSNVIRQPAGHVSDQVAEPVEGKWISSTVEEKNQAAWEDMARAALGAGSSKGGSAADKASNAMALRWEFLRSVFSGSVSSWAPHSKTLVDDKR